MSYVMFRLWHADGGDLFIESRRLAPSPARWLYRILAAAFWLALLVGPFGFDYLGEPHVVERISLTIVSWLSGAIWTPIRFSIFAAVIIIYFTNHRSWTLTVGRIAYVAAFPMILLYWSYSGIRKYLGRLPQNSSTPLIEAEDLLPETKSLKLPPVASGRLIPRGMNVFSVAFFLLSWNTPNMLVATTAFALLCLTVVDTGLRCLSVSLRPNPRIVLRSAFVGHIAGFVLTDLLIYVVTAEVRDGPKSVPFLEALSRFLKWSRRAAARAYLLVRQRRTQLAVLVANAQLVTSIFAFAAAVVLASSLALRIAAGSLRLDQGDAIVAAVAAFIGREAESLVPGTWTVMLGAAGWLLVFVWLGPLVGLFSERRDYFEGRLVDHLRAARAIRSEALTVERMCQRAIKRFRTHS